MDRWIGRVALVTGASTGIGAAICRALVQEGMIVVGCAREVERIQQLADEIQGKSPGKLHAIKCDLTDEEDITEMFHDIRCNFGRLDVCINNAGFCSNSPLLTATTEEWRKMLQVNVMALCICTQEAIKLMRKKRCEEGQIIHISSLAGHTLPDKSMPGFNFYCGTKFMVRALAEGLRQELLAENVGGNTIRVACVSPGLTQTEFLSRCFSPETAQEFYKHTPCLKASDVADAVLYILKAPPTVNINDILFASTDKLCEFACNMEKECS